jgi:cytochrome c oxidase assembly protein Cox11
MGKRIVLLGQEGNVVYEAQNLSMSLCVGQWLTSCGPRLFSNFLVKVSVTYNALSAVTLCLYE